MNCTKVRAALPGLLYDDLLPEGTAEVEKHLADCSACRREYTALQRLQQSLDTLPVPAVEVDWPRLYRQAAQRQQKRLQRWRRAAGCLLAVAAVLLLALGMKLEVRLEAQQLVVRWGAPPAAVVPAPEPPPPVVIREAASPSINPEELRLVKDLLRALAADVEVRDRRHQETLAELQGQLEILHHQSLQRWAAAERDVSALYTAQFGPREKGAQP